MNIHDFIPLPDPSLEVLHTQNLDGKIQLFLRDPSASVPCPDCNTLSTEPRMQYTRKITDLPFNEKEVEIILFSSKWVCGKPSCNTKIFTQRYPWVRSRRTRTIRVEQLLIRLAASTSCLTAEKLARSLHIPVSHDAILNLLHETEVKPEVSPFCIRG